MTTTLTDIENLTPGELKTRRAELVAAAQQQPAAELAERYVKARLDASLRDERLGEQGRIITTLQDGLEAKSRENSGLTSEVATLRRALDEAETLIASERAANQNLLQQIESAVVDCRRWRELARGRRAVLAKITSEIAPLLAEE